MNTPNLEDMGCGTSSATKDKKSEKALKAALVIQNWYRGYSARLKTRQRYALTIFQSIEYADEQGQLQLSNFFSFMLENYTNVPEKEPGLVTRLFGSSIQDKDRQDYLGLIEIPDSYCGPRLQFPLTFTDIDLLIEAFKQQQILHAYYVLEVLFETKKVLQQMPNFTHTNTSPSKEITICGDLHGKLDDLFLIFYKLPPLRVLAPVGPDADTQESAALGQRVHMYYSGVSSDTGGYSQVCWVALGSVAPKAYPAPPGHNVFLALQGPSPFHVWPLASSSCSWRTHSIA